MLKGNAIILGGELVIVLRIVTVNFIRQNLPINVNESFPGDQALPYLYFLLDLQVNGRP